MALIGSAYAQDDVRKVLVDDPALCNGYFIKNVQKCRDAGVAQIDVEVIGWKVNPDGEPSTRTLKSFSITDGLFDKIGQQVYDELEPGERVFYHLTAMDGAGNTVVDYNGLPTNPDDIDLGCSTTCIAATSAWTLKNWLNNTQGTSEITLNNAVSPYGYYYFYVPLSQWETWWPQHPPTEFDLGAYYWHYFTNNNAQTEVIKLEQNLPGGGGGAPAGSLLCLPK